jgi:hypothetical protein
MMFTDEAIAAAVARGLQAARDQARPTDQNKSAMTYAVMTDDFQRGAFRHLDEQDLPQASNKGWGMVAETIKAISAHHGGIIHSHNSIWLVVRELSALVRESGDEDTARWINNSFDRARGLHANFYENEQSLTEVGDGLLLCHDLSDILYDVFWPDKPLT